MFVTGSFLSSYTKMCVPSPHFFPTKRRRITWNHDSIFRFFPWFFFRDSYCLMYCCMLQLSVIFIFTPLSSENSEGATGFFSRNVFSSSVRFGFWMKMLALEGRCKSFESGEVRINPPMSGFQYLPVPITYLANG